MLPPRAPGSIALLVAWLPCLALAAPFAYVPNEKSASVSIIDTATDQVVSNIPVDKQPRGIATDPAGSRLFVTDAQGNDLVIVDAAGRRVLQRAALGKSPEGVSVSRDGLRLAAAVEGTNSVVLMDPKNGERLAEIKVQGHNPEHAVFSPDGRWLYVSAEEAEQVDVIDVSLRRQVSSIPVGKRPRGIAFLPDGSRAYVACELANTVYAIDVASQRVVAEIRAGQFSNGVAVHPDGKRV